MRMKRSSYHCAGEKSKQYIKHYASTQSNCYENQSGWYIHRFTYMKYIYIFFLFLVPFMFHMDHRHFICMYGYFRKVCVMCMLNLINKYVFSSEYNMLNVDCLLNSETHLGYSYSILTNKRCVWDTVLLCEMNFNLWQ